MGAALVASRRKILVFIGFVLQMVLVMGTVLYVIEGPQNGFTSIPVCMYWAVTTMTTVGFGDITPKTDLGRLVASAMMLLGWGVLAVPTGIVMVEIGEQRRRGGRRLETSPHCGLVGYEGDARYCRGCGGRLGAGRGPEREWPVCGTGHSGTRTAFTLTDIRCCQEASSGRAREWESR